MTRLKRLNKVRWGHHQIENQKQTWEINKIEKEGQKWEIIALKEVLLTKT